MTDTQQCATEMLATLPLIMRSIDCEMHQRQQVTLTMHQFRTLMILHHHAPAQVSLLAEHLEVSMSAVSKMVDGLVERGFVARQNSEHDRRCVILTVTDLGLRTLDEVHAEAIACLANRLGPFTEAELATITQAMRIIKKVFRPESLTPDRV